MMLRTFSLVAFSLASLVVAGCAQIPPGKMAESPYLRMSLEEITVLGAQRLQHSEVVQLRSDNILSGETIASARNNEYHRILSKSDGTYVLERYKMDDNSKGSTSTGRHWSVDKSGSVTYSDGINSFGPYIIYKLKGHYLDYWQPTDEITADRTVEGALSE